MATLLVSLGTSPAIVVEAFLLPTAAFHAVHVLTTDSVKAEDLDFVARWFAHEAPHVSLTVTRVADFGDFRSEADHFRFEEVLYRWWLQRRLRGRRPYVCLSGGFKTMSAAMQKAATMLGAAGVFHVLCDLPVKEQPRTGSEVAAAAHAGHLHWIQIGAESGWPQLRQVESDDFPLETRRTEGVVTWVAAPDNSFRDRVQSIVQTSQNVADAWTRLGGLPFPVLATWSPAALEWLTRPLDPLGDREWLLSLPKVELHCHLGGFATHGMPLAAVRAAAENPLAAHVSREVQLPANWPEPDAPVTLHDYMRLGDATGSNLLRDPGCLRRQCELLYAHFRDQQVHHAEVRCSPANYASSHRSPWTVLSEIKAAFDLCMRQDRACHVNLLIIATRKERGDYRAAISRHLALAVTAAEHWIDEHECRVVGVDLAGYEDISTRAHYFREEFTAVHRCGLALTVHAGENDDAEGVWRAVFDLNARRLGHALHLVDSPELVRSVAARGVTVEMCPHANYQIKGFHPMPGQTTIYPLKRYLDEGIRVTVNTDNIGISSASLTDNFAFAARLNPTLTRLDVLQLVENSVQAAFLRPSSREHLRNRLQAALKAPVSLCRPRS